MEKKLLRLSKVIIFALLLCFAALIYHHEVTQDRMKEQIRIMSVMIEIFGRNK